MNRKHCRTCAWGAKRGGSRGGADETLPQAAAEHTTAAARTMLCSRRTSLASSYAMHNVQHTRHQHNKDRCVTCDRQPVSPQALSTHCFQQRRFRCGLQPLAFLGGFSLRDVGGGFGVFAVGKWAAGALPTLALKKPPTQPHARRCVAFGCSGVAWSRTARLPWALAHFSRARDVRRLATLGPCCRFRGLPPTPQKPGE